MGYLGTMAKLGPLARCVSCAVVRVVGLVDDPLASGSVVVASC